jgi:hypothetical protein
VTISLGFAWLSYLEVHKTLIFDPGMAHFGPESPSELAGISLEIGVTIVVIETSHCGSSQAPVAERLQCAIRSRRDDLRSCHAIAVSVVQ